MQGKALISLLIFLVIGFGAGFALRPVIAPTAPTALPANPTHLTEVPSVARGTQYFATHLDEARQIVAQCADGTVRGDECSNAEQAVAEEDGRARFRKFMGN